MKVFKILSKIALLLIIFGFFQPVACEQKGFDLADTLMEVGETTYTIAAIGLYVVFFAAVLSILYTLFLLLKKEEICAVNVNWNDTILLFASIIGGVVSLIFLINEFDKEVLNKGFYFIVAGWISSLILSFFAKDR